MSKDHEKEADELVYQFMVRRSTESAILCIEEKQEGIINVLGNLKVLGELSDKMYLKALDDINKKLNNQIEYLKSKL